MPKTSIKLFAFFKYLFQRHVALLLFLINVSYCFLFCAAAAIEEENLGEIDLELCSSFMIWLGKIWEPWELNELFLCSCSFVSNDMYGPMPVAPWNRWKSKASEIFSVHACCIQVLFSLARFWINMIPYLYARWKVLTGFVILNKQESAIKSPDKKSESPRGSPIFCRGFFEVW